MAIADLDQHRNRLEKRAALIARGISAYPARTTIERTNDIASLTASFDQLVQEQSTVGLAGRIRAIRAHGELCFADLEDGSGSIQLAVGKDRVGSLFELWETFVDLGDFIAVSGRLFKTKRGERTVRVESFDMLTKALLPLPDKRKGLVDAETRLRHRELDLLTHPEVRRRFVARARLIQAIRDFLNARGFLEVETPVLQTLPGGTNARPFRTRHESLGTDLFLRIAPELYLKRLLIGGYERVYEVARCFRNEGIDREHSPEFTQVEFYIAYADYEAMMNLTEELFHSVLPAAGLGLAAGEGESAVDFGKPFERRTYRDVIRQGAKLDIERFPDRDALAREAARRGIAVEPSDGRGKILDAIFKTFVRPKLIKPTFVLDLPIELSPLAKKKPDDDRYAERFQLLAAGTELANAFTELNDPEDQRARFVEQQRLRDQGDEETQPHDREYVEALMYGMPPAAGIGIGIDRLVAILTGAGSLREAILFPTLREKRDA